MTAVLRTGALTATVSDDGWLRDVRAGGVRVLDAVYAAVRDPEWATLPGEVSDLRTAPGEVTFTVEHAVGLRWTGRATAAGDTLTYTMDATVHRPFAANRVGLCLLHPIEVAGRPVTVHTPGGAVRGVFPDRIAAHQPFTDITGLSHDVGAATVDVTLDGALFEMEDHRNWTDAGFKTYCTPLRLPAPVHHRPGQRLHQRVTLRLGGTVDPGPAGSGGAGGRPVPQLPDDEIRIGPGFAGRLPQVGFGVGAAALDPAAAAMVRAAGPAYLHVEVGLGTDWEPTLAAAVRQAAAVGVPLDIALVVPPGADVAAVAGAAAVARPGARHVFVFDAATGTTTAALADTVRATGARSVGGGSRTAFAEFHRADLPTDRLDVLTYPVTPQVHHTDDRSVLDTLLAQPHTVRDARLAGRPVVVGPITLGRRENPQAAVRRRLPSDPRHREAFGAAWALGCLAAMRDADALTFFDTTGPGGLGGDRPYPVHAVFAALAGHAGAPLRAVAADPRRWAVLAVHDGPVLLGNLDPRPGTARVDGTAHRLGPYEVRVLG